jgi:hypothetical protein
MDDCYRLVGLIRTHWKGLSGGNEVWAEIAGFFSALRARADIVGVKLMPELSFKVEEAAAVRLRPRRRLHSSCAL